MKILERLFRSVAAIVRSVERRNLIVALAILVIVTLFVTPVTSRLLDVLIAINLAIALAVLVYAVVSENATRMFAFSQILLLTTFYRLALSVTSTRLILLRGDQGSDAAGRVIEAFGTIVVKGDFIVGIIVFAVITIVNFVVIAKGSARVAEVAARFMLDALPGKQLAIDSDLRAGTLTKEEASRKRAELSHEAQFFGSMDGAMKFVQGDAIAALVIVFINSIGGVAIGMSRGLAFADAVNTFGVLTIGDGLVHLLPALLISVGAGIVVTQVSAVDTGHLPSRNYRASSAVFPLIVSAAVLVIFALLPGFPAFPFLLVAAAFGGFAVLTIRQLEQHEPRSGTPLVIGEFATEDGLPFGVNSASSMRLLGSDNNGQQPPIIVAVDRQVLAPYLGLIGEPRRELGEFIRTLSEQLYSERGVLFYPPVFFINEELRPGSYQVLVRGSVVRRGKIAIGQTFVLTSPRVASIFSVNPLEKGEHPLDGRVGYWVSTNEPGLRAIEHLGVRAIQPYEFLALQAFGAGISVIDELFGLDEVKRMLIVLRERHEHLVDEVLGRSVVSYAECTELLRRLVREQVSIRDLKLIVEAIAEYNSLMPAGSERQQWLIGLHEHVRSVLGRSILGAICGDREVLRVFTLTPDIEEEFRAAVGSWEHTRAKLPLEPEFERSLRRNSQRVFAPAIERGMAPIVVVCSGDVRFSVQEFFSSQSFGSEAVRVVAYEELRTKCPIETVGSLAI